jgi:thermostable 8-oxoguanine DNA glycosylase
MRWQAETGLKNAMYGIRVFSSLAEAKAAGFRFYDKTAEYIVVRREDARVMSLAIVQPQKHA